MISYMFALTYSNLLLVLVLDTSPTISKDIAYNVLLFLPNSLETIAILVNERVNNSTISWDMNYNLALKVMPRKRSLD